MKTMTNSALLLGLATLLNVACATNDGDNAGETVVAAPESASATPQEVGTRQEVQAEERGVFGGQAEAFAQPVPPELERQLEAAYQASVRSLRGEQALPDLVGPGTPVAPGASVDFEALFEKIRNTMPPARRALLMQYVAAAEHVSDPGERTALLDRLSSPELNNVRRGQ